MTWSKSTFWKAFLFVWLVYSAFVVVATGIGTSFASSVVLLVFLLINAVALFGLAYERTVGWIMFWRVFLFLMLAVVAVTTWFSIVQPVLDFGINVVLAALADQAGYLPYLVPLFVLIQILNLYGLYVYAFDSAALWTKNVKKAKQPKRRARTA